MPDLCDYDAWLLDSGLALRYSEIEKENKEEDLHTLIQYIKGLMKVMGAKGVKVEKFVRNIVTESDQEEDDGIPELSDILKLTGEKK